MAKTFTVKTTPEGLEIAKHKNYEAAKEAVFGEGTFYLEGKLEEQLALITGPDLTTIYNCHMEATDGTKVKKFSTKTEAIQRLTKIIMQALKPVRKSKATGEPRGPSKTQLLKDFLIKEGTASLDDAVEASGYTAKHVLTVLWILKNPDRTKVDNLFNTSYDRKTKTLTHLAEAA